MDKETLIEFNIALKHAINELLPLFAGIGFGLLLLWILSF